MRRFVICFLAVLIRAFNAFEISQIEGISCVVKKVAFDRELNVYALCSDNVLYKINSEKKVVWDLYLQSNITFDTSGCGLGALIFNKQNDLIIDCVLKEKGYDPLVYVLVIRAGTTEISILDIFSTYYYQGGKYLLDDEDNLFYSTDNFEDEVPNLRLFRSNASSPVIIKRTEGRQVADLVTDYEGNIYGYVVKRDWGLNSFFVITKEGKHEDVPKPQFIDEISENIYWERVTNIVVSPQNDIVISTIYGFLTVIGYIKKRTGENWTTVASQDDYEYYIGKSGRQKEHWILVAATGRFPKCQYFFYFSNNDTFSPFQVSMNNTNCPSSLEYAEDGIGNVYFAHEHSLGLSTVEYLKHGESTTAPINFFGNGTYNWPITSIALDINGNLWMINNRIINGHKQKVFEVEKGTLYAVEVPYFKDLNPSEIWKNPYNKEIFITCEEGGLNLVSV